MPTFFLSRHSRFFDFDERRIAESSRKLNPTRNISTIDFTGALDSRHYPSSIKNVSIVGSLMNDNIESINKPGKRQIYINKYVESEVEYLDRRRR